MNPRAKRVLQQVSDEKFNMVKDRVDRALFLSSLDLKFRNSFYLNKDEIISSFERLIDENKADSEFIYALAWYLGKVLGVRLSPVLLTTRNVFLSKGDVNADSLKTVVKNVFTRPDFLANALFYYKKITGSKSINNTPAVFKNSLKDSLESFSDLTLKKRKLKRRDIKLADLIKVLRPTPANAKMSTLYKSIIENTKGASLQVVKDETGKVVKADHVTAVLSDVNVTETHKVKYINDNLSRLPINALIANISKVSVTDESAAIIGKRFKEIFSDENAIRFLNPFDLIMLSSVQEGRYSYRDSWKVALTNDKLRNMIDSILMEYFVNVINIKTKRPLIMFDISGSMSGEPAGMGIKVMSFLLPIINRFAEKIKYYDFGTSLVDVSGKMTNLAKQTPYNVAQELCVHYKSLPQGTALLTCLRKALESGRNNEYDSIVIVSDEMTWADSKRAIEGFKDIIPEYLQKTTFLYNVNAAQTGGKTAIEPSANISRVSGLDAKSLFLMEAMFDFDSFKVKMIEAFNSAKKDMK